VGQAFQPAFLFGVRASARISVLVLVLVLVIVIDAHGLPFAWRRLCLLIALAFSFNWILIPVKS
jgi:hypothetical protein